MASFDFSSPASRRDWTRRLCAGPSEIEFNAMAKEVFAWQFSRIAAYARLCRDGYSVTPDCLNNWRQIPAVPQQLFKLQNLFSHGSRRPGAVYATSGTTTGQPGRQFLLSTDLYRGVAVDGARRAGLFRESPDLHFLTPAPKAARHSSLSAMFGFWQEALAQAGPRFWVKKGKLESEALHETLLAASQKGRAIGLAGTAFSFVHLLDAWSGRRPLPLPPGSWLLETGGFKGRSREIPKADLYSAMARMFGVPEECIGNEYGMSELSSQAYARGTKGLHFTPPWARVLVWDPVTNREVQIGRQGMVRWIDLANVDSVIALQTLDLAERTKEGFRLIGRLPRTEPRGCSLGAEDMQIAGRP